MIRCSIGCSEYDIQKSNLKLWDVLNVKFKKEKKKVIRKFSLQDRSEPGLACCLYCHTVRNKVGFRSILSYQLSVHLGSRIPRHHFHQTVC